MPIEKPTVPRPSMRVEVLDIREVAREVMEVLSRNKVRVNQVDSILSQAKEFILSQRVSGP